MSTGDTAWGYTMESYWQRQATSWASWPWLDSFPTREKPAEALWPRDSQRGSALNSGLTWRGTAAATMPRAERTRACLTVQIS